MEELTEQEQAERIYQWVVEAVEDHLYSEEDLVQYQFDNLLDFE